MSSRVADLSLDEVEHLSNGFGKLGRGFKSSRGSNHGGSADSSPSAESSQNGWDSDEDELKEADVWGSKPSWDHTSYERSKASSNRNLSAENGSTSNGSKGRRSWLTMELQAVDAAIGKKKHAGVGFAGLDAVQNGGWAPGFSMRKVKMPQYMGGGVGGNGYLNGWREEDDGGKMCRVPQSAPVSMPVWPARRGYGSSNGGAEDADGRSACEEDGDDEANDNDDDGGGDDDDDDDDEDDDEDEDDDDDDDMHRGRLAPHEIVDREYARSQSTTFSVIEGAGRTLKGMDLRRVRNAVWSRTGFED